MTPVDWSRPIEAVHEEGRVVPVALGRRDETMDSSIFVNGYRQRVHFDGKEDWAADWGGLHLIRARRIRNVQPTTPELDPALWDRMEAFVRAMAVKGSGFDPETTLYMTAKQFDEARAIVADLPKPVDPDWQTAKAIVAEEWPNAAPENEYALHRAAWLGIRSAWGEQA